MKHKFNEVKVTITLILLVFAIFTGYSQSWSPLGGGTGWGNALTVYNGDLYAGGAYGVMKWNGASWEQLGVGVTGEVKALIAYNGKLIVGGMFSNAGNTGTPYLDQWDGSTWSDLGSAPNSYVSCLTVYANKLIIGGYFTQCENLPANHLVQYDGNNFTTLGSGTGGSQGQVMALTTYSGELIAGGFFSTAGGITVNRIAKWNGTSWGTLGSGIGGIVYALGTYNNNLVAGGLFSSAGGVPASDIALWDGNTWSALGSGCSGGTYPYVFAVTSFGGDLYAGGMYAIAGGQTCNGIAKWNGSSWSPLGSGFYNGGSNAVGANALTIFNNELIATGLFNSAGGTGAGNIAKWNGLLTGISHNNQQIPDGFKLYQNYPNPFNPSTKIKFDVPKDIAFNPVQLRIYNQLGQEVAVLINENLSPGTYEYNWDASRFSSGEYFSILTAGDNKEIRKMVLVK